MSEDGTARYYCKHCRLRIFYHARGIWFRLTAPPPSPVECKDSPDGRHAPEEDR